LKKKRERKKERGNQIVSSLAQVTRNIPCKTITFNVFCFIRSPCHVSKCLSLSLSLSLTHTTSFCKCIFVCSFKIEIYKLGSFSKRRRPNILEASGFFFNVHVKQNTSPARRQQHDRLLRAISFHDHREFTGWYHLVRTRGSLNYQRNRTNYIHYSCITSDIACSHSKTNKKTKQWCVILSYIGTTRTLHKYSTTYNNSIWQLHQQQSIPHHLSEKH